MFGRTEQGMKSKIFAVIVRYPLGVPSTDGITSAARAIAMNAVMLQIGMRG